MDFTKIKKQINANSPELLVGMSIAGMAAAMISAVRATPKALELIEENGAVTPKEKFKATWKIYLAPTLMFGLSAAAMVGSNSISSKRKATLATACSISEMALREYKNKVVEVIGEEKEKEIRDAVAKEKIDKKPLGNDTVIIGSGEALCFEPTSGRYFKADAATIKRVGNELNHQILHEMNCSFNEWCDALGIPTVRMGDDIGWNVDDGVIDVYFSTQLTENDVPCLVLNYSVEPHIHFDRLH